MWSTSLFVPSSKDVLPTALFKGANPAKQAAVHPRPEPPTFPGFPNPAFAFPT
jgi:hypothetical protein